MTVHDQRSLDVLYPLAQEAMWSGLYMPNRQISERCRFPRTCARGAEPREGRSAASAVPLVRLSASASSFR